MSNDSSTDAIYVAVRMRPLNSREKNLKSTSCIQMSGNETTIVNPNGNGKTTFTYDQSYGCDETQDKVYQDLGKGTIAKAMEGINGTIFAYGQTGSGKTYSMTGDDGDGIIPRLIQDLMEAIRVSKEEDPTNEFLVQVSYLEIYMEKVKDLINPTDTPLQIREDPEKGIFVQGLDAVEVETSEDIKKLIEDGNKVRKVASTRMNENSSRSHSCLTITIFQEKKEDLDNDQVKTTKVTSKLNLVDLAGSERNKKTGATGAQLKEGAAINKSLSALGNVINALSSKSSKKSTVPPYVYRDSKLTRLLQESLGGNSRTIMLATISPASDNYQESLSTLNYAKRAKTIKNKARKNVDVSQEEIRQLKEEVEKLRREISSLRERRADDALILEAERADIIAWHTKALTKVPMFKKLSKEKIDIVLTKTTYQKFKQKDVLCKQHDIALEFYIIVTGICTVSVKKTKSSSSNKGAGIDEGSEVAGNSTRKVGTLRELDFFGENALSNEIESKRNATVIALSEYVQVLMLSKINFELLVAEGVFDADVVATVAKEKERREELNRQGLDLDDEATVR